MTTFSYPLTYPTVKGISTAEIVAHSVVGITRSPFTGTIQVQAHQGQWFEGTIVHPPMSRADAEEFLSFFGKLNGVEGTFLLGVPGAETNRGTAASTPGTPIVDGAGQAGNDLLISGGPSSETGWLLPGDYIQIDTGADARLHKVLLQVNTTAGGAATITIWPNLRESPPDTTAVEVQTPKGVFRLMGDSPVRYEIDPANLYRFQVDVMENL